MLVKYGLASWWLLLFFAAAQVTGADLRFAPAGDESDQFRRETVLKGLDQPCGLLVRESQLEEEFELLLAERGAGRVVRWSPAEPERVVPVLEGITVAEAWEGEGHGKRMLGLGLLTWSKLVVAGGGAVSGQTAVRVYELPKAGTVLDAKQAAPSNSPVQLRGEAEEVEFSALAVLNERVFFSARLQRRGATVFQAGCVGNRLEALQPLAEIGSPLAGGIALIPPPRPAFLVVADTGPAGAERDSQLQYFVPASGELAMALPCGLFDVVSLVYGPSGQLYAADFSVDDPREGGVFRLDDARVGGRQACRAVRIAHIQRPVAMALSPVGELYVVALGDGETSQQGQLIRITGNL